MLDFPFGRIEYLEKHMARDFDVYLYDVTFSSVPLQVEGPWEDTPANRLAAEKLLGDVTIENGFRLIVANLQMAGAGSSLQDELELASTQVEGLLKTMGAN